MDKLYQLAKGKFKLSGNPRVTANYGWLYEDGTFVPSQTVICHAGLRQIEDFVGLIGVVSQVMGASGHNESHNRRDWLGVELCEKYYDWLLNRSPLADCYYTKDATRALKDNFIITNVDQPGNAVMAACISHRYLWEESKVVKVWGDLVSEGVDERGAFVLAHCISAPYDAEEEGLGRRVSITATSRNTNHTIFGSEIIKSTLPQFVSGERIGKIDPMYKDSGKIRASIDRLFENSNHAYSREYLTTAVTRCVKAPDKKLHGKEKEEPVVNPFAVEPSPNRGYHYASLIGLIAEAYPQILEECKK